MFVILILFKVLFEDEIIVFKKFFYYLYWVFWLWVLVLGGNDGLVFIIFLMFGVDVVVMVESGRVFVISGVVGFVVGVCSMVIGEFVFVFL